MSSASLRASCKRIRHRCIEREFVPALHEVGQGVGVDGCVEGPHPKCDVPVDNLHDFVVTEVESEVGLLHGEIPRQEEVKGMAFSSA